MTKATSLRKWMWRAFVQSALIPLILVETVLVAAYLLTNAAIRDAQIEHLRQAALSDLQTSAGQEAELVSQRLQHISDLTALFGGQVEDVLTRPDVFDDAQERARWERDANNVLYSRSDDGRAAVFYSAVTPPERQDLDKVMRVAQLDRLMKDTEERNSLVAAVYFNTHDSYNRIWPWFYTPDQYPYDMDIPRYNFYYLADAEHNPERRVVWTDIYVDPAGQGWMMSALAPVYRGDFLEGVAGLDITVGNVLQEISSLRVPWGGYAMLVSDELNIMALPASGEADLGLTELTDFSYDEAIRQEIFKPSDFNLSKRGDTRDLAALVASQGEGVEPVRLGGRSQLAAWATIPETGWKLITVVDEAEVFRQTNDLASHFQRIGYLLIAGLVLFYLLFFAGMWIRSRQLSHQLEQPIAGVGRMMSEIGEGNWFPERQASPISELDQMASTTVAMGRQLADSEQQRQQASDQLERVLESTTESLWEVDLDQREVQIQGRLPERLGLEATRLPLERFFQRIHPDDLMAARDSLAPNRLNQRLEAEYRLRDSAGQYHWVLGRGRVVGTSDSGQRPLRVAGTHVDIDAIKATQEALRTASQQAQTANIAKSRFLSSMSHELRTPLNVIQGFAQLLELDLEKRGDDAKLRRQVEQILHASQHLGSLIDDVLDLARIEAERPQVHLETVDARQLVLECVEQVRPELEAAGLGLDNLLPEQPVLVVADVRRLRQVLLNLLSNAIKYNRPQGSVSVSCEPVGDLWQVRINDSGRGISLTNQTLLFKPFQRLGHENSTIKGTGIGLALCNELAGLMGGRMGCSSQEGVGSSFWIELPAAAAPGSRTSDDQAAQSGLLNVVYVEDDRSSQILVEHALSGLARVTLIENGLEALHLITERPPEVLLLDIDLPDMQGDRLLRSLRSSARTRDIPVIVISAGALPEDRERVSDLDVLRYLTKPLQIHDLREALQQVQRQLA